MSNIPPDEIWADTHLYNETGTWWTHRTNAGLRYLLAETVKAKFAPLLKEIEELERELAKARDD